MKTKLISIVSISLLLIVSINFMGCGKSDANQNSTLKKLTEQAQISDPCIIMVSETSVPDSLRFAMAEWVKETVRAASNQMTGGDYEDPEDVIVQAEKTANRLFSRTTRAEGMRFYRKSADNPSEIRYENLSIPEKKVFDELKKGN